MAIRQLARQTAVYGLSTVAVRLLNYLLVPFHTRVFTDRADYGIISELYAYVTFLNVIFLFGLETAFFRFATGNGEQEGDPGLADRVFRSALGAHVLITAVGCGLLLILAPAVARVIEVPGQESYVRFFALIIAFDTLAAIPFARLRLDGKPLRYAGIKLLNVGVNVGLNLFFLWPLAGAFWGFAARHPGLFAWTGFHFEQGFGVGYVFLANLLASLVTLLAFLPMLLRTPPRIDPPLMRRMLGYAWPLVIVGFAGMINETLDRILLVRLLPGDVNANRAEVGIYSAVYKLAIFMTLAVQAFRMGAEPFFFRQAGAADARQVYARVMTWFVALACLIFLVVSLGLPLFGLIIGERYREGLAVVPVLLMANLLLGVYYNLSVWYKLTDRTRWAMLLVGAGAAVTLVINWVFIPVYGYWASAWATLVAYATMTLLSWAFMRRYYPVPYRTGLLLAMIGGSALVVFLVRFL